MRTLVQRVVITIVSTILLAALGGLGGILLGHSFALNQVKDRLDHYANRLLLESVTSTAESRAILATMNTSAYASCSEAEIEYFRQLIFQSQFLKAAGRMRDGRIECSTTAGRNVLAESQYTPNISRQDGTKIYKNLPPFRVDDQDVISLQEGDSFIVYNPYILASQAAPPMHFTATAVDAPTRQIGQILGESPNVQQKILTHEGKLQLGNTLYATRCSNRRRDLLDCLHFNFRRAGGYPRLFHGMSCHRSRRQELSSACCSPCSTAATRAWSSSCFVRFGPTPSLLCISRLSISPPAISSRPRPWCAGLMSIRMR